jgi:hypothetical protein
MVVIDLKYKMNTTVPPVKNSGAIKNDDGKLELGLVSHEFLAMMMKGNSSLSSPHLVSAMSNIYKFLRNRDQPIRLIELACHEIYLHSPTTNETGDICIFLQSDLLKDMVRARQFGAKKYTRDNWKQGFQYHRSLNAALRHILEYMEGTHLDAETNLSHLAHAMCSLEHLIYTHTNLKREEFDDRYNPRGVEIVRDNCHKRRESLLPCPAALRTHQEASIREGIKLAFGRPQWAAAVKDDDLHAPPPLLTEEEKLNSHKMSSSGQRIPTPIPRNSLQEEYESSSSSSAASASDDNNIVVSSKPIAIPPKEGEQIGRRRSMELRRGEGRKWPPENLEEHRLEAIAYGSTMYDDCDSD